MRRVRRTTMGSEEIPREGWRAFLEEVSETHLAYAVTIEIVGLPIGDQEEAEKLPFVAMTYDDRDDAVVTTVGGPDTPYPVLRHIVSHPQRILAHPPGPGLVMAIDVVDGDGVQHVVTFDERPKLPPPDGG
jgi:hypothetical protein